MVQEIPIAWQIKPLSEIAKIKGGKRVPKGEKLVFENTGFPYIRVADFSDDGTINLDNIRYVPEFAHEQIKSYTIDSVDLYISIAGTIGKAGIVPKVLSGANLTENACKLVLNKCAFNKYVYYFTQTDYFVEQAGLNTRVAAMPKLALSRLGTIKLPFPPIPEQKRIVDILDQAFADIEQARAKTEQNLRNARELFESYLQQVFSQRGEGWTESELFDHVKFIDYRGKTPKKTESGLRLITAKNVRMGFLKPDPQEFVSPDSYDTWMTRGVPLKGDILFTTEAPLANVAQLDTDEKVVFAQRIITMQPDRSVINSGFLKYLLMSQPIQKKIHEKGTGATATGIKASLLKKISINYPSCLREQKRWVDTLDGLTESVNELEQIYSMKLNALDELKKSILHLAFTGQLTHSEKPAEAKGAAA